MYGFGDGRRHVQLAGSPQIAGFMCHREPQANLAVGRPIADRQWTPPAAERPAALKAEARRMVEQASRPDYPLLLLASI